MNCQCSDSRYIVKWKEKLTVGQLTVQICQSDTLNKSKCVKFFFKLSVENDSCQVKSWNHIIITSLSPLTYKPSKIRVPNHSISTFTEHNLFKVVIYWSKRIICRLQTRMSRFNVFRAFLRSDRLLLNMNID